MCSRERSFASAAGAFAPLRAAAFRRGMPALRARAAINPWLSHQHSKALNLRLGAQERASESRFASTVAAGNEIDHWLWRGHLRLN